MFVDRVRVSLRGGNGGAGVAAFARSKGRPRGKPTGGNGGPGGSVVLRADRSVATLLRYERNPHYSAGAGAHGEGDLRHGKRGADETLPVPLGTVVFDDDGVLVADLVDDGQEFVAVLGGRGGLGNAAFVSTSNRAPTVAEQGEYGPEEWFTLEMRLLADAALIGFPNAGKSTFISTVSAAKPKIADYPFTTLEPNLGVVTVSGREFVLADIPGLIEGAADGKGLGHEFLRHAERARCLVMLLDPSETQMTPPAEQLDTLRHEIASYSPELAERPSITLMSKSDLPGALEAAASLGAMPISSISGEGVDEALHAIGDLVDLAERDAPERRGFILYRPLGKTFDVRREEGAWRVEGKSAERAVAFADLTSPEAADMAARRLAALGVDEVLRQAGAIEGDEVRIGSLAFEYTPDIAEEE